MNTSRLRCYLNPPLASGAPASTHFFRAASDVLILTTGSVAVGVLLCMGVRELFL